MAGNVRFESSSCSLVDAGFIGSCSNGQSRNYPGAALDRSGSFREGSESRLFGSGTSTSRGSGNIGLSGTLPPLSQCLMLEPLTMSDQKYTRSGELRRALGFSFGSTAENNSFGAAHSKPTPPVATEELRRLKASVADACFKAKDRTKRLDGSLHRLNKYFDVVTSKKQQRNELLGNERSGGSNLLKLGTQIHRNAPDLGTQRLEDRTKNVVLNKRVRTSVAETRGEGRTSALPRQPLVLGKDRDTLKEGGAGSDLIEDKIRRLSTGGEGWDKKMKRKRSVGTGFTRPMGSNGELKRTLHHKLSSEPGLQSCDPHSLRSGSYDGASCVNKMDGNSLPASSNARSSSKSELEKVCLSRDQTAGLNKERLVAKGNKSNICEDNHMAVPSPVTKGKASRALRMGPVLAVNSSPNISRACGALEGWEQPESVNKIPFICGANNRKRPLPTGSSSPPMAQWAGQRLQKMSRTRRANLVSPVSNHDEAQMSSESSPMPDFGARVSSSGINLSFLAKSAGNDTQQFKVKLENVSSPARLSESEESGARENRLKEKGTGNGEVEQKAVNAVQNFGSSVLLSKKNKTFVKEEIGDGVRRQGRSGRGSLFSRGSISPVGEKLETPTTTKPLQTTRPSSDNNGSKSRRPPLKKLSDRKAFTRSGLLLNSGSPDLTGEWDDDREELLAAAKFACKARYTACSGSFWKKMEPIFASVYMEDTSFLKKQLIVTEELPKSISQIFSDENNALGEVHEEISLCQNMSKESATSVDMLDQLLDVDALCSRLDSETYNKVAPLYQRVLSALIVEDENEIFEDISGFSQCARDDSRSACFHVDVKPGKGDPMEYDLDSILGHSDQKKCVVDRLSCNGGTHFNRGPSVYNPLCNDELLRGCGFTHSDDYDGLNRPHDVHEDVSGISSFDRQYETSLDEKILLELQSIGLYPETVPDLAEGDSEVINQEIIKLKKELCEKVGKKKAHLGKLYKAIEERKEMEERGLEQVAMDRLVELAYKKQLATRGSNASKSGISKVPKQVALAFIKRTLARCQRFEETGRSCFDEPALRDAIFAAAPRGNDSVFTNSPGLADETNLRPGTHKPHREPRASGSFLTGAERHDLHNDKIDRGSVDTFETFTSSSGQPFVRSGPISNRGMKKEVFLDDFVGSAAFRATSVLGSTLSDGAKGKRSERDRDKDTLTRNLVAKSGRPSVGSLRGERKTKSKPRQQKTAQLSASGHGFTSKFTDATHPVHPTAGGSSDVTNGSSRKREVGLTSPGNIPQDSSTEIREPVDFANLQLHELDSIEELGAGNDLGGNQDLTSWLNFDEDGLQDHDSMGLEIPMDDLSELNMLL